MIRPTAIRLGCVAALLVTTACANECGPLTRIVRASGRFGDTLAAISGDGVQPGTISISAEEYRYDDRTSRHGFASLNTTGVVDSVTLYRMTLRSDPLRPSLVSTTSRPTIFNMDSVTYETLWVHLATEDVLFEVTGKNGGVAKALLNLESRTGPAISCRRT